MSDSGENPNFEYKEMDPPQATEPDHSQEDELDPTTSVCNSLTITLSFFVGIISILLVVLFILLSQMQAQVLQVQTQTEETKEELTLERKERNELESEISQLDTDTTYRHYPPFTYRQKPTSWKDGEQDLGAAIEYFNNPFDKILDLNRWTEFSNGLYYKFCVSDSKIHFADAEKGCKTRRAQLASTGIRNSTIRREIFTRFSEYNTNTWIGLSQPYDNATWVWSDGKLYDNADMPWGSRSCSTMRGRRGAIYWSSFGILSCYQPIAIVDGYICERRFQRVFQNTQP